MAETPNYHVNLWPEPPGPPTYLCLILDCTYRDATLTDIAEHIAQAHGLTPVPTPLAADASLIPALAVQETPDASEPNVLDGDQP